MLSESANNEEEESIESYLKTNYPLFESTLIANIPNIYSILRESDASTGYTLFCANDKVMDDIDKQRKVSAHIFNIAGEKVKTLFENQNFNSGNHIEKWQARNDLGYKVSNGIYFIQFVSENILLQRKIIYVK